MEAAEDLAVCVGFLPKGKEQYKEHLGWSGGSLAYHGDDGKVQTYMVISSYIYDSYIIIVNMIYEYCNNTALSLLNTSPTHPSVLSSILQI